jgi:glycerate 2-kinase
MSPARELLQGLYATAVAAAHPRVCLPPHLPPPPTGRLFVLAAGKAAGAMAEVAERHYLDLLGLPRDRVLGLAVTRHGYARPTSHIAVIEAGHPVPDAAGVAATERTLDLAAMAGAEDLVLVLLSGGASANWIAPVPGLSLQAKQGLTRALLRSGAAISEINAVRKHLSRIKGGRLAARAGPAPVVTLAISDVAGDDPAVIGSGPTVPDPSSLADARGVLARYRIDPDASVARMLRERANETPKPGDPAFSRARFQLIARPADALAAAAESAKAAGYECVMLGDHLEGEARDVAAAHATFALALRAAGRRALVLSGGELTVTLRGQGRGGPNQEYALALAAALDGTPGIAALAGDTDGTDGGAGHASDPAGALVDATTLLRARSIGLDPAVFLAQNDSTGFFDRLGDLLVPGPTYTNVNDFRAILVDTPAG